MSKVHRDTRRVNKPSPSAESSPARDLRAVGFEPAELGAELHTGASLAGLLVAAHGSEPDPVLSLLQAAGDDLVLLDAARASETPILDAVIARAVARIGNRLAAAGELHRRMRAALLAGGAS